ncbi:MAG TPA: HisA/HisF-related TIM barrel protein [Alphaproteobacteria bacterium]|nr:HisA/HisF-related TIM barrel protein [Alphaproteobacteria bacterium]
MRLVPVIDLKSGTVVHAKGGRRARYLPVRSRLCAGSSPVEVIEAFLRLHPFQTVYVADLDAIEGAGSNRAALAKIRKRFPGLELWVDSGVAALAGFESWQALRLGSAVVGSESVASLAEWRKIMARAQDGAILSLDFRGRKFLGPAALADDPALWPQQVIVMSLARVGGGLGPDIARLSSIAKRAAGREMFAAGGVRNAADLRRLSGLGVSGALVASALHDGRIGGKEIARLTRAACGKPAVR